VRGRAPAIDVEEKEIRLMRRLRIMGSVMLAGASLAGALSTANASAALPELGRCLPVEGVKEGKKTVFHGAYTDRGCTHPVKAGHGNGKYEFTAGPGAENKFSGIANEPEPVLETTGGTKIECSVMIVKGEYTGAKTEKANVSLGGCQTGSGTSVKECQTNPAKEGEIEGSGEFEGELGTIASGSSPTVGWDLKRSGPEFAYECAKTGEVPVLYTVEGSVIGVLTRGFYGTDVNKMSIYAAIKYKQAHGKQEPESFEGMPQDVFTTTSVSGLVTQKEQTGLATTDETTSGKGEPIEEPANQEPLEVKTKP
jgi:hypothetical protein